jgi:uridine kinase
MKSNKMKVIAISGVSGSGKTSVIKQLSQRLSCPYLLFDEYTDEDTYPKDMKYWFKKGANESDIKTPNLITSLRNLVVENDEQFMFIEEPFGRRRDSISAFIDYVILLDIPMEICLSRVIMRNIKHPSNDSLSSIPRYLSMYNDHFREIYIEITNRVREDCDLVIQEVTSIELTAKLIITWLNSNEK